MLSSLTPADIANTVRLTRTLHSGAIVITEGGTDFRVYKRLFSKAHCRLVPSNGKENAIQASILLNGILPGVLTIVDADFDTLDSVPPPNPNILFTETHDLETMLLKSSSLEKVLSELLSHTKAKILRNPLIVLALEACYPLGCFRWLSSPRKENLNLRFKGLLLSKFISLPSFKGDADIMISNVIANTSACTSNPNELKAKLLGLIAQSYDKWQVCSGHDLVEIIFVALKSHLGNNKAKKLTLDLFDSMLRIAYDHSDFAATSLYQGISAWQTNNAGFQVVE